MNTELGSIDSHGNTSSNLSCFKRVVSMDTRLQQLCYGMTRLHIQKWNNGKMSPSLDLMAGKVFTDIIMA